MLVSGEAVILCQGDVMSQFFHVLWSFCADSEGPAVKKMCVCTSSFYQEILIFDWIPMCGSTISDCRSPISKKDLSVEVRMIYGNYGSLLYYSTTVR